MAATGQPLVSAQVVGSAFVQQYYSILHGSPDLLHRFYQDISKLGRPEDDGLMSMTTTMTDIDEKVLSLNYGELVPVIKTVDAQESYNLGVHVLVTGYLSGKDDLKKGFVQSFFLAPQERGGYFVLNDMFRYVDEITVDDENQVSVKDVEPFVTIEQGSVEAVPVQEDPVTEETIVLSEETKDDEEKIPSENGEAEVAEEEVSVAEVVNEVQDDSQLIVEANIKIEEMPKKSYASIVMDLKGNTLPFSSPAPALRRTPLKSQPQQVNPALSVSLAEVSVPNAPENGNIQEGEADGYSVYIKGLPYNATPALVENEFKGFGTIKTNGIQVRSKTGFCFGFVEFEEASAVQKAIEASPIMLGGRSVVVEEKKSTNSRGNNRGRFQAGRGPGLRNEAGFRNEGMRGRGNYVASGRGYGRAEFGGRSDYNNRGSSRGGSSNRGGDGYQRSEGGATNGSRVNRVVGLSSGGTIKNMAPRVPASA